MQRLIVWTTTTVCAGSAFSFGNLIANPSFESVTAGTIDNWTTTLGASSRSVTDYGAASGASPYGDRFLGLNAGTLLPGGNATQDFGNTVLGGQYLISFAYAQYGGATGDQTLTVTINNTSAPSVLDTHVYNSIPAGTNFATIWQRASFTFTGTSVPTGITFADTGTGAVLSAGSDLFVDDVSIELVPEPGTMGLAALGGVVLLRRRGR